MNEIQMYFALSIFVNGLLFTWLKWDIRDLRKRQDEHSDYHLKKGNGKRK